MGLIGQSIDAGETVQMMRTFHSGLVALRYDDHGRLYLREDGQEEECLCEWKHSEWNNVALLASEMMKRLLARAATHPPNRTDAGLLRFLTVDSMVFILTTHQQRLYAKLMEKPEHIYLNVPMGVPMVVATWEYAPVPDDLADEIMLQLWLAGESLSMDQEASLTAQGRL